MWYIITKAIEHHLDNRARREMAVAMWSRIMRRNTNAALLKLRQHIEEMAEIVQLALDGDTTAIDFIIEEYCGQYTKASKLAGDVAQGQQQDDGDRAEEEYQAEQAQIEAERACKSERA